MQHFSFFLMQKQVKNGLPFPISSHIKKWKAVFEGKNERKMTKNDKNQCEMRDFDSLLLIFSMFLPLGRGYF